MASIKEDRPSRIVYKKMRRKDSKQKPDNRSRPEKAGEAQPARHSQSISDPGKDGKPEAPATYSDYFSKPIVHILLIVVFTLVSYSNSFHVPFQFDDLREISGDHAIKNPKLFADLSTHGTRYVGYLSFAVNYALHGLDVVGYHIFNVAIHLTNALFVYWLIILTFRTPTFSEFSIKDSSKLIALFSALFFASHPVQTEAVTYIVQRLTSLATLFYLLSIISYVKARLSLQADRLKMGYLLWYGASLFSAALAMKTKEISFTLPAVITLYEFIFFKAEIRRRVSYLFPLFLTMLIIPLSLLHISKPLGDVIGDVGKTTRMLTDISRWDYLFTQFRVITTYIRLVFLPVNQNLNYDYPLFHSFFNPQVFLSSLFLLSILSLGIYLLFRYRKSAPHAALISFGIFWFFITLSVESSVIPISDVIFEHRLYLPSIGFFIALITIVYWLGNKLRTVAPIMEKAILPMLAVIVIALTGATIHRNTIWKDELTFWSDVVTKSPNLAGPRNNLGNAFEEKGLTDKAIEQYQIVLARYPNDARAHENLGVAFLNQGLMDKAVEELETTIKLRPDYYDAYYNIGLVFFRKGWTEKAIGQYESALRIKPDFALAYVNMGIAYGHLGNLDKAVNYFETAVNLEPNLAEAHYNLGTAYGKLGSLEKAIGHLQTAVKLRPNYFNAHYTLGKAYITSGSTDNAIEHLQAAVNLQPDNADAHSDLGKAYVASGSIDKGMEHLQQAVKLQPDLAEAHKYLGDALYRKGLTDDAIEQFQKAIDINPNLVEAHKNMGDAFFRKRSLDLAIRQYEIALRLNPKSADARYNLGVTLYNKGLTEKAIEHLQIVLGLRPEFAEAHNSLGTAYLKSGAVDKATVQFQMAVKLKPGNPLFVNNLSNAYKIKNQVDKSKSGLTK